MHVAIKTNHKNAIQQTVTQQVTVFPNPVQSPYQLNILLQQVELGTYNFKLCTRAGNIIWIKEELVLNAYNAFHYDLHYILSGFYSAELLFLTIELKSKNQVATIPILVL